MHAYLDWNATTPPAAEVVEAMVRAAASAWANPASVHGPGRAARAHVEDARAAVGELLGLDPRDVLLTSGGTEANNLALFAPFSKEAHRSSDPPVLVTSRIEHPSVGRFAEELELRGVEVALVSPEPDGATRVEAFEDALVRARGRVKLVSLQAVNHETGVLQPVAKVAELAHRHGAWLHCDAVQAVGRLPASTWEGADLVTVASHKIRGPKGIGALATVCGVRLHPLLRGGAQERGVRPGTQDPVAAAGFTVAAHRARVSWERYASLARLRDRLEASLLELGGLRNGEATRAPHVSNVSILGWLGPELCAALDLEGVAVSSGAACSAGTADPSPVISAMVGDQRARSALRFSLGEETTEAETTRALEALRRILGRVTR